MVRIRWWAAPFSDVEFDVEPYHTTGDLLSAASVAAGIAWEPTRSVFLERTGERLDPTVEFASVGLVSGDTITFDLAAADRALQSFPDHAVSCDVTQGPAAGQSFVLSPGRHSLGSALNCAITIHDPTLAPLQAWLVVDPELVTSIEPHPDTINPTLVNGEVVDELRPVGPDDVLQTGATALSIRSFQRASSVTPDGFGQIPFIRTPRRAVHVVERTVPALEKLPVRPEPNRFSAIASVLPLASGLTLFAFTRQPQFLLLTLMSPVAAVGNFFEGRRRGKSTYNDDVKKFETRLAKHVDEVQAAIRSERADRIAAAPDLADLVRRVQLRTLDLWERDRYSEDFLSLRLGLGDHPSKVEVPDPPRGDDEYVQRAKDATKFAAVVPASPVAAAVQTLGVLGVHGQDYLTRQLVNSLVMQATALHSPEDLVLAVIAADPSVDRLSTWARWLPHTWSGTTPISGPHVVVGADGNELLRELVSVGRMRTSNRDQTDLRWPWILLVVTDSESLEPSLLSQVLDFAPGAGISAIIAEKTVAHVRRQAAATVALSEVASNASLSFVDHEMLNFDFTAEFAGDGLTDRFALAMAPLRDASSASTTSAIPRVVPLFTLFDGQVPTAESIAATWAEPVDFSDGYSLLGAIGFGPSGPLEIDLVEHGPHALIGGTSGAGKSELLQSIVAGLIYRYPPTRLTFLFVDYKGGASSAAFATIPHTVGYVTNLEESLALRALESLRAELNRRMAILSQYECKDLADLLKKDPDAAPPSLIIIVDEFATLVKEVPEFVVGVVDVAQRGRSLGIHLILATQRPSGSVNDNILANTNLRISLRMLDKAESTAVLGVPVAADIPVPLKGRAFAKLGPRDIIEFQSGFTGAPADFGEKRAGVHCWVVYGARAEGVVGSSQEVVRSVGGERTTQLDVLLDAVVRARPDLPAPHKPWRDELPPLETLATLRAEVASTMPGGSGRNGSDVDPHPVLTTAWPRTGNLLLGRFDEPRHQQQDPKFVDLEQQGGLLVAGGGGSGKTTALRTLVGSAISDASPQEAAVVVIDAASYSLGSLRSLPHCAGYASGDDLEGITRIIVGLQREIGRRRAEMASHASQADTLTAYLNAGGSMSRVLVVIDGYQNVAARLREPVIQSFGNYDWLGGLNDIAISGRQVGIHVVVATDRRQALPPALLSAIGARLVLRQMEESSYTDLGIPLSMIRGMVLGPGRGILDGQLVQVACVGADAAPNVQSEALAQIGEAHPGPLPPSLVTLTPTDSITNSEPPNGPNFAWVGAEDVTGRPVGLDLNESGLLIVGPPRSGRSTVIAQIAASLAAGKTPYWTIGLAPSLRPTHGDTGRHSTNNPQQAAELLAEMAALVELSPGKHILLVDDVDRLDDPTLGGAFAVLEATDSVVLVGSFNALKLNGFTSSPLVRSAKDQPNQLVLRPESALELMQVIGMRADLRPGLEMRPGRGILVVNRSASRLQVFQPKREPTRDSV